MKNRKQPTWVLVILSLWISFGGVTSSLLRNNNDNDHDGIDTASFQRSDSITTKKSATNTVKVVLLAGQSNMVGAGSIDHLLQLIHNSTSSSTTTAENDYRQTLWNETTQDFVQSDRVYLRFQNGVDRAAAAGPLTVGKESGFAYPGRFGVEATLGLTLQESLRRYQNSRHNRDDNNHPPEDEIIYLIKTAWGGKSLAVDFRPPASGQGPYDDDDVKPSDYGTKYRQMVQEIRAGLDDLPNIIPHNYKNAPKGDDDDDNDKYEILGFVWFQGWNDMIDWRSVDEYDVNLVHLMGSVRQELDLPSLPVVVGELGNHGPQLPPGDAGRRVAALRLRQRLATLRHDQQATTRFVETARYAVVDIPDEEQYDGIHHYYGRAEPYFHIGRALADGLLQLLLPNREDVRNDTGQQSTVDEL
mmetsp:Transcript_26535/g.73243  ORF Transcript_26535/g.73243 Transcript_26535/m.73243 type:complete len:415 (+) Transcript_26535:100-1344(+)